MGFYGYGYPAYVSVAQRRQKAEKAAAKAKKAGKNYSPIEPYRGAIAKTVWGQAWCDNLEAFSDYENRLPRGAKYVRNGSVIDLQIAPGKVSAKVMGSNLYTVDVAIKPVAAVKWKAICTDCAGSIDSLVELLQGKLSGAVMQRISAPVTGLFPAPKEISFDCSCPDWAGMCKHIAAVMYGVGKRLDDQPELLFGLRGVDAKDLVAQAGAGLKAPAKGSKSAKVLDDAALADVFGLEMDEGAAQRKVAVKKLAAKKPALSAAKAVRPGGVRKTATAKTATTKTATTKTPKTGAKTITKKIVKSPPKAKTPIPARPLPPPVKSKPKAAGKTKPTKSK